MRPRPLTRARRKPPRSVPRFEVLEDRALPSTLLDPLGQPKFVNPLPNPLDPSFLFQPATPGGSHYEIGVYQFQQDLGLRAADGTPLLTTVWGYGTTTQAPTYPGRTIVAQRDRPITVEWVNNLVDASGNPLPHLLPVDPTLHWADPLGQGSVPGPYTGPVPIVTHLHGGNNRSDSDGLPDAWFTPDGNGDGAPDYTGRLYNRVYTYDNTQEAATLWYHDHALGVTRLNVYAGLAGFYLLRDGFDTGLPDNPARLPAGRYEIPIVVQDRSFTETGQLFYPSEPEEPGQPEPSIEPESFGDIILVNGKAWPFLDVEPRKYRFRLLNGSDSRFYTFFLSSGQQFVQVGTDGGLLRTPVPLDQLTLAPGERADVVVDFSDPALWGQTVLLRNHAKGPFPRGDAPDPETVGQIMAFRVVTPLSGPDTSVLGATLRPEPFTLPGPIARTRQLGLFEGEDEFGRLRSQLGTVADGALRWGDPFTENPSLNDVEVWEIYNTTPDTHPIHIHEVQFQIVSRQKFRADQESATSALTDIRLLGQPRPPEANEAGFKDTVQMNPGEVTRIIIRFDRPGEYVWHCHILSHEDHEMMRPYFIGAARSVRGGQAVMEGTPSPTAEGPAGLPFGADLSLAISAADGAAVADLSGAGAGTIPGAPLVAPAVIDRSSRQALDLVLAASQAGLPAAAPAGHSAPDLVFAEFEQRPWEAPSLEDLAIALADA